MKSAACFAAPGFEYHGTVAIARQSLAALYRISSVTGSFNLSDVHRWDMMNEHDRSWTVNYKGAVDSRSRTDRFSDDRQSEQAAARGLRLDEADRSGPSTLSVNELAASTLVGVARDLGAPMPKGVSVDGRVVGMIGFASHLRTAGRIASQRRIGSVAGWSSVEAGRSFAVDRGRYDRACSGGACRGRRPRRADWKATITSPLAALNATISGHGLRLLEPCCHSPGQPIPGREMVGGFAIPPD